jgi:hypothetical protein
MNIKFLRKHLSLPFSYFKSPSKIIFLLHSKLIDFLYGPLDDFYIFAIPIDLNDQLLSQVFNNSLSPTIKMSDLEIPKNSEYLFSNFYDGNLTEKKIDASIITYDLSNLDIIQNLSDSLEELIKPIIKSPFMFVNTRAWTTIFNTERFGPNAPHYDGFYPGHLKIMIYCSGLNKKSGMLQIDKQILKDYRSGTCVLFKNSDILHSGIPGESEPRYVVEVTVARTLKFNRRNVISHPLARHFSSIFSFYNNKV